MPSFNPFTGEGGPEFDPQAWAQAQPVPDFGAWERELAALVEKHFVAGGRTGAEGALSGKPAHDPAGESILSVDVRRSRADVHTVLADDSTHRHYTYRLVEADDDWRIAKVLHTPAPPVTPLVPDAEVARLLAAMEPEPASEPASDDLASGMSAYFSGRFEVTDLGVMTTSGVLTAHDFGWVRFDVAPFHRRVPAGTFPVAVARDDDGTNLAVRVRFSDQEPLTRVPALRVGTGNVVSVDAGNVAILDFAALSSSTQVRVEEIHQAQGEGSAPRDQVFSLTDSESDAVIVQSGYGDGAYPAFWGVAADGSVVDLLVDFLVAVEDITRVATVPWLPGRATHPDLEPHDFEVIEEADRIVFRFREQGESTGVGEVRLLDATGDPVPGRGGGTFVQGHVTERSWLPDGPVPQGAVIEVTLHAGYRHV